MTEPKYVVIEIQTANNGIVSVLSTAYNTRNEAESKYHTVLAAAALSDLPVHSAVLLDNYGGIMNNQSYTRTENSEET